MYEYCQDWNIDITVEGLTGDYASLKSSSMLLPAGQELGWMYLLGPGALSILTANLMFSDW